jgi:hypothetical protein
MKRSVLLVTSSSSSSRRKPMRGRENKQRKI